VAVNVSPGDAIEVERAMLAAGKAAVVVRPDPSLAPGSMVVTSDVGTVDGRLEVLLPRLVSVLVEALENG
jgi:flagellar biosynthesis/type III secretory pathway protein FliH